MRGHCRGLFALLVLAAAVRGQEPKLEWKFDKPFSQKWHTRAKQAITIPAATGEEKAKVIEQTQDITLDVTWTPMPPGDDKTVHVLKLKLDSVVLKAEAGGTMINFDSKAPADKKDPLDAAARKLIGAEVTVTLKAAGPPEVTGVDMALKDLAPEQKAVLAPFINKDAVVRVAEAAFPALPDKKGATKKVSGEFKVAPLGSYKTDTVLTYADLKDKVATINVQTKWTFVPLTEASGPFWIKSLTPPTAEFAGQLHFDTEAGRIIEGSLRTKERKPAKVQVVINKATVEATVSQSYEVMLEKAK